MKSQSSLWKRVTGRRLLRSESKRKRYGIEKGLISVKRIMVHVVAAKELRFGLEAKAKDTLNQPSLLDVAGYRETCQQMNLKTMRLHTLKSILPTTPFTMTGT